MEMWKPRCSANWLEWVGVVDCEWLGEFGWLEVLEWLGELRGEFCGDWRGEV